jgi:hypothetical protein
MYYYQKSKAILAIDFMTSDIQTFDYCLANFLFFQKYSPMKNAAKAIRKYLNRIVAVRRR